MLNKIKNYKKSYLIINVILSILLIFFVANIFIFKQTSFIFLITSLLIPTILLILIFGYEKKSRRFKYESLFYVFAYCVLFLLVTYLIGIFIGFTKNVYKLNLVNLINNIIPYLILIVISEVLRYEISRKGEGSLLSYVLVTAILICVDLSVFLKTYDLSIGDEQIKFICAIAMPSFFKNICLIYFNRNGGIYPSLLYRLLLDLKIFIFPIFPNFGIYWDSVIYTVLPVLMTLIIRLHLKQYKYEDDTSTILRKGVLYNYLFYFILLGLVLIINILVSCSFTYNMIAIGSNSMSPKIDKGDAVIYEKFDGKNMPEKDQILVFHKDKKIIVHRIVDIVDISEKEKIYYTKGDNNISPDGYPIETKDIVGVVKTKIKYIGIPSVLISELIRK